MKQYTVRVSSFAAKQIAEYGVFIAKQSGHVEIADRWMDHVYASMQKLHYSPRRFVFAEENKYRNYEIHRQIIGQYLALYTVDDETEVVQIIGFRQGNRLPRPDELPD